ncbi:MAG: Flp pilus assembly complex ATPase component TadA [Candidatus Nomurabacteria bacterium]|jgi:type II secretory ATPase GspE/PulE/Tfp pilus assembly ATPase PilB-like protein|nr:Flp pilus assembly complex ATPase component TadA [Candidatus Nomurabacteria bacterium]
MFGAKTNLTDEKIFEAFVVGLKKDGVRDIHIEPSFERQRVRVRRGTVLKYLNIANDKIDAIVSQLKTRAHFNSAVRMVPTDSNFYYKGLVFKVFVLPVIDGEKIFVRITDVKNTVGSLAKLGMKEPGEQLVQGVLQQRKGLILVLGEGKTTTMFSIFSLLDARKQNLISVENHASYRLDGVSQYVIDKNWPELAEKAVKIAARQWADAVLISQIDSPALASGAIELAMNQTLVIASLPTNDPFFAISYLRGLGVPPFLIAHCLKLVIFQRLVLFGGKITGEFGFVQLPEDFRRYISADLPAAELQKIAMEKKNVIS